jgi:alpha-mannosidase
VAEGQFDVIRRPLQHPHAAEGASTFYPQQAWAALEGLDARSGQRQVATVINQGLPEFEIYPGPGIAVTLLRTVSYLSRRGEGPEVFTPEAQCPGEHTFRYALLETPGDWESSRVWQQAQQFNVPLLAVQGGPVGSALPRPVSFISVEPAALVVTAIKRAEEDEHALVVRLFNISDAPVTGGSVWVWNAQTAALLNLNEEVQRELTVEDGAVTLETLRPKEIVTLRFI